MVSDLGKTKRGKQSNTANSTFSENKKVMLISLIQFQEKTKIKTVLKHWNLMLILTSLGMMLLKSVKRHLKQILRL